MKQIKIFLIVLSVLFSFIANAQSQPQTQSLGTNSNVQATVAGYFKALKGVAIPEYPDTTTANLDPYLKNLNGQTIKVGKSIYMRNTATKEWVIQRTVFADSVLYVQTPLVWNAQDTILYMTQANNTTNGWITAQNYIDWYNKADGPLNALLSTGGLTLADTTVTLHAPILWRFNGLPLSRVTDTSFKINRAPIGYKRLDAIYIDSLGVIRRKQGTADTANAALPILDYNAIPVTYIDVSGQVVTEPQVISLYQRTAVITVDPTTGKQTSDSLAMSMQTSGPQSHSLNIDKTAPPGTSSGVQLNNRRAEWYGNFNGSLFNVGGTLAGGGVFDVSKGYHFQNKGNDYLVINSTSNTNHLSKFLTKLAVTDIPDYLLTPTYVLTLDGDTIKKVAFPSGGAGSLQSVTDIGFVTTNPVVAQSFSVSDLDNYVLTIAGISEGIDQSAALTFKDFNTINGRWMLTMENNGSIPDSSGDIRIQKKSGTLALLSDTWSPLGNSNMDSSVNFLGTTDYRSLYFRTNNDTVMKLTPLGSLIIGKNNTTSVTQGFTAGTQNTNLSTNSIALGYNNTSNGFGSIAGGGFSSASGDFSMALGYGATATQYGFAANRGRAMNQHAFAVNYSNYSYGQSSSSFGYQNVTRTYAGFVLGRFNDTSDVSTNNNSPSLTDRLFQIGNGGMYSGKLRYNALTVLYSGRIGIGWDNLVPTAALHIKPVSTDLTPVIIEGLGTFADDTAAGAGGLTAGMLYKTSTGQLMIKL